MMNLYNSEKSLTEFHSEYVVAKLKIKSWIDNDTTITKEELQKILKENVKIKEENEILKKNYNHIHKELTNKVNLIKKNSKKHKIRIPCKILDIPKSTYYKVLM